MYSKVSASERNFMDTIQLSSNYGSKTPSMQCRIRCYYHRSHW